MKTTLLLAVLAGLSAAGFPAVLPSFRADASPIAVATQAVLPDFRAAASPVASAVPVILSVLPAALPAAASPTASAVPAGTALTGDNPLPAVYTSPASRSVSQSAAAFPADASPVASAVPAGAALTGDNPFPAVYTSPVSRSVSQAAALPADASPVASVIPAGLPAFPAALPADDWPEALSSFAARADTCGFRFSYVIRTTGGTGFPETGAGGFSGTGEAVVQGGAFRQTGDGMSRYCNGTTLWLIDETEKEAVIEPIDREMPETGLAALFSAAALEKYFAPPATEEAVFNGVRTDCFVLLPSAGHADGEVERLKIHFQKDLPIGLEIQFADGALATISLLKPRFLPRREPLSAFEFASEHLDASWTVTDLRD